MSLARYKQKRSFKETPEPQGGKASEEQLRFVIQKHAASHLHYDFRLEMEGVLKSWAVPKGPTTDPDIKRLAMMVEDHPYDYRTFEGIIPKGQYGGGTVIVWDEGTYEPAGLEGKSKKEQEKYLLHGIHSGKLHFILHGKKLKGEYALVKTYGRGENSWLLMKIKDKYVSKSDIGKKDKSVVSGKTLEQVTKTSTNIYGQTSKYDPIGMAAKNKGAKARVEKVLPDKKPVSKANLSVSSLIKKGKPQTFPKNLRPCLAKLIDKPFDDDGWLYEIKWDGYRALAFMNRGKVELKSRNDKSFNEKFYLIYNELKEWKINAVIDGEIVVISEDGLPDFGALQNWRSEADGQIVYYVFDILWIDGKDLTELPLIERREILNAKVPTGGNIRISVSADVSGVEFFEAARKMGLEGIMAKKKDSLYSVGNRTSDWLKIKSNKRQEMVIGGFTKNVDTSKTFSSLLVGVFEKGNLIYKGKVGTGFNEKMQAEMIKKFKPLITTTSPFQQLPDINKPSRFRPNPPDAVATWLKPKLVCEVSYAEMTSDGVMRHPSFEGMRTDKKAKDVVLEKETKLDKALIKKGSLVKKKLIVASKQKRRTFLNPTDEAQVRTINGHELKFTNLSKIYWPAEGITKRDMLNYYYQIAPFILPYLKDRPQSLNRFPNGITGENFYFKDFTGKSPEWIETYKYHSEADNRDRRYLVGKDEASLLYMASLGSIEMNPWSSVVQKVDYPTWCVIDLDPDKNSFDLVIEAAQMTKEILDELKVPCYCKTSGSTGLHIYIPLGAKYTYEQSKEFARVIVTLVHDRIPEFTSIERIVARRKGKMYLDFLQNRPQATIAAPYSVRPKPDATVSIPLHWEEVKKGLKMKDFTIFNTLERVQEKGDIFKPVLGKGINLEKIIKAFDTNNATSNRVPK